MKFAILLDSSFWMRLFETDSPLGNKAQHYFKLFEINEHPIVLSTIAIAEYCVRGSVDNLPITKLTVLPFKIDHALRAAQLAAIAFNARKLGILETTQRLIIPNDVKLFAQADAEPAIKYYISSDTESLKIYQALSKENPLNFEFIDLNEPLKEIV